jgi:hypothetical protein
MKVEITSLNCCIALTERQWEILRKKENAHDEKSREYKFFPSTWQFPNSDKVDDFEWNGHFGRNVFFRAMNGAEKDVLAFLQKYLK